MGAACCGTKPSCGLGQPGGVATKLSIMMFIQFFVWGAWFTTPVLSLHKADMDGSIGGAFGSAPIAAIIAPLFLGIIADRFFSSEKVMGVLLLIGGLAMCAVPHFVAEKNASMVFALFLVHMLCYMPTLGLGNTIAFANIKDPTAFGKIRVWGTIGWIVAGLANGFLGWSDSLNMFYLAGGSALLLGAYSFALPNTPPPAKGQPLNLRAIFMVDAFKMLASPAFAVFILCSTLICIPLAYYYGIAAGFLDHSGFQQPASTETIGQMSEIIFMLLIPFFFRKLGVKWMILAGMLAWVARYMLFAFGAPTQTMWMIYLAIALHGICYDFFFVTGFIYTEKRAPKEIKGQAQSMLVFFTQGIGMFLGFKVAFSGAGETVAKLTHSGEVTHALGFAKANAEQTANLTTTQVDSIAGFVGETAKANLTAEKLDGVIATFVQNQHLAAEKAAWIKSLLTAPPAPAGAPISVMDSLAQMFSVKQPAGLNASVLADTMEQWKTFWMAPAIMAGVIAVIFFVFFWDKSVKAEEPSLEETAKAAGAEELP